MYNKTAKKNVFGYLALSLLLIFGHTLFRSIEWQGSAQLHTVMEAVATFLALFVGVMALVHYYSQKNIILLFVGVGFLGTSFLDGYHAIVTSEYFRAFMPSKLQSLIPWSWSASRLYLSLFLLLSWFAWYAVRRSKLYGKNLPIAAIKSTKYTLLYRKE